MKFWSVVAFMRTEELVGVAELVDEAGFHGVMVPDHLVFPRDLQSKYPYSPDGAPIWQPDTPWPDSWVLIGAMAGATTRLHFCNSIYIAPARPILSVARQVGTAAVVSGNRVALGAGAGWMKEEFDLMGQDYATRGKRLDEMIQALRELWKPGWVEFHGRYYDIPPLTMAPAPSAPIPIYTGGHSDAALRRAARYADGWIGNAYPWDEAAHHISRLKRFLAEEGRADQPFEIIIGLYVPPDVDTYRRAEEELGVTGMLCQPWADIASVSAGDHTGLGETAARYRDPVLRFADDIVHKLQA